MIHGGAYCVSEVSCAMVDGAAGDTDDLDPAYADLVDKITHLRQLRADNEALFFAREIKAYRQLWRDLIFKVISDADILVGTPRAAKSIADNPDIDFDPLVVWSDEAGRANEAAGLASFTFFPNAVLRALSGDVKQPQQIVLSGAGNLECKVREGQSFNQFVRQVRLPYSREWTMVVVLPRICVSPIACMTTWQPSRRKSSTTAR